MTATTPDQARSVPSLRVVTTRIANPGPLVTVLDRERPLLWRRRGFGIAGHGEAWRLTFAGEGRMAEAADAWRTVVAAASVDDPVGLPGTGLVAFGAFSFDPGSARESVLVVPSVVIGRAGDDFWLTRIRSVDSAHEGLFMGAPDAALETAADELPQVVPLAAPVSAEFSPGELSRDGYEAIVRDGVAAIRSGRVSKVVLARDVRASIPAEADIRPTIAAMAEAYPDCWTFAIDGFFGSSPETLVSVHDGVATARVLAGSAARGTDAESDAASAEALATSQKDQDEHEFAVQSVLAALRPHSRGVVASEVPFTLRLPNVWHLASDVEGVLDDGSTSLDLIQELHPTAAVAGTPTLEAMALIRELEPFDRGLYAGPVGWVGADGDGEWAIALRSAEVRGGTVTAWAGAGIMAESDPQRELLETRMKLAPVLDAFDPV